MDTGLSIIGLLIVTGLLLLAIRRGLVADETLTRLASVATIAGFFLAVFVLFLQGKGSDELIPEPTVISVQLTDTVTATATDLSPTPTLTLNPSPTIQPSSTPIPFTPTNLPPTIVPSNTPTEMIKMPGRPAWLFPSPTNREKLPYGLVITLAWSSVPDAVAYQLQLSGGGRWYPSGCGENGWMTGTACRMGMQGESDQEWRVIARNALGQESEPSDILQYSIVALPHNASMPGKPAWINPSPSYNAIVPAGSEITLAWTSVPGAVEYQLQLFYEGNWTSTGCGVNGWMTGTGCIMGRPTVEHDYIWRVIARNALGQESEPSEILRYTIKQQ